MKRFKLFLILLASLFAAPVAFADEIGGGSPNTTQSSSAATTTDAGAECSTFECWVAEFLAWFE